MCFSVVHFYEKSIHVYNTRGPLRPFIWFDRVLFFFDTLLIFFTSVPGRRVSVTVRPPSAHGTVFSFFLFQFEFALKRCVCVCVCTVTPWRGACCGIMYIGKRLAQQHKIAPSNQSDCPDDEVYRLERTTASAVSRHYVIL